MEKRKRYLLTVLWLAGILVSMRGLMDSWICLLASLLTGTVLAGIRLVAEKNPKTEERVRRGIYLGSLVCFLLTVFMVIQGFLAQVNLVITLWNHRFGTDMGQFRVSDSGWLGSICLWTLLSVPLVSLLAGQIRQKKITGLLLAGLPAMAAGSILSSRNMWLGALLFLLAVLGTFLYYSVPDRKPGKYTLGSMVPLLLVLAGILALTGSYRKLQSLENWKQEVKQGVEEVRYGKDTLPQGNMYLAAGLQADEKERLQIQMETPQELYLRGYVGGTYADNKWEPLQASAYRGEYDGMLQWLEKENFSPQQQYASYDKLTRQNETQSGTRSQVTVKNTGAYRKYLYLPATASDWSGSGESQKDWQIQSRKILGTREYSFSVVDGVTDATTATAADWLSGPQNTEEETYLQAESVYHAFVDGAYRQIDPEQESLIRSVFFEDTDTGTSMDLASMDFQELTTQIRQVLRTRTSWTGVPENLPQGKEYLRWFLEEQQEGNAAAYATAAVLAYRAAGYPARYVEGYHLAAQEKNQVTLTSQNAHAWAEVYVAGEGWLPVEVVPGMYTETYTNQIVEGKPAYQVGTAPQDDGVQTAEGSGNGVGQKEKKPEKQRDLPGLLTNILLIVLYGILAVYLLLELQRAIRIQIGRKQKEKDLEQGEIAGYYVKAFHRLAAMAGIDDRKITDSETFFAQIREHFPQVPKRWYQRSMELIQKERFGGKKLESYEQYTLECFEAESRKMVYEKQNLCGKLWLRYGLCVEK